MIGKFKAWLSARRKAAARAEFDRGFNYAAGELLRGTSVERLEIESDCCFDDTQFDDGMAAAIVKWGDRTEPQQPPKLQFPAIQHQEITP